MSYKTKSNYQGTPSGDGKKAGGANTVANTAAPYQLASQGQRPTLYLIEGGQGMPAYGISEQARPQLYDTMHQDYKQGPLIPGLAPEESVFYLLQAALPRAGLEELDAQKMFVDYLKELESKSKDNRLYKRLGIVAQAHLALLEEDEQAGGLEEKLAA